MADLSLRTPIADFIMVFRRPPQSKQLNIRLGRVGFVVRKRKPSAGFKRIPDRVILIILRISKALLDHDGGIRAPARLRTLRRIGLYSSAAVVLALFSVSNVTIGTAPHLVESNFPKIIAHTKPARPLSHLAVAHYIAERFHVSVKTAKAITHEAYVAAKRNGVKPAVVLAVAAVESGYKPRAINPISGARGLMQILPRWHEKQIKRVGGINALFKIGPNIRVGTEILAIYLHRSGGRLNDALFTYCGHENYHTYVKRVEAQVKQISTIIRSASTRALSVN